MTVRRIVSSLVATLCALGVLIGVAPSAWSAPDVEVAAKTILAGDSVYNDPAAENSLSSSEVSDLTTQIRATGVPIFIAVLPDSAKGGGTVDDTLVAFKSAVGLGGVYAVIAGNQFRAGSTKGSASDLATQAFQQQKGNGVFAVLSSFVSLTGDRFGSSGSSSGSSGSSDSGSSTVGMVILGVLLFLFFGFFAVVIGVIVFVVRRSNKKKAQELADVRKAVDADITEYGERLGSFSLNDPDWDDATRADMQRALDSYDRAKTATAGMRSAADAVNVTTALEDGRYALACVEARLAQQALPERRPPCFVDPRHGPSVADVDWSPPGLTPRAVPMCAACKVAVESGQQPQGMLVTSGGTTQPYWQAGPAYAPYARGYYSPFGDVMTGVMVGTMLSGMWSSPAYAQPTQEQGWTDGGSGGGWSFDGGGGGDFGGGGFGGGDFGGGGDF
jgi:hypothetical protein